MSDPLAEHVSELSREVIRLRAENREFRRIIEGNKTLAESIVIDCNLALYGTEDEPASNRQATGELSREVIRLRAEIGKWREFGEEVITLGMADEHIEAMYEALVPPASNRQATGELSRGLSGDDNPAESEGRGNERGGQVNDGNAPAEK